MAFALLMLAAIAVMWPGAKGPFLFDDYPNIVNNPLIQSDTVWKWSTIERAARGYQGGVVGRPLATIGFAMDFQVSGKDPIAFKIHNIVLHAINAALVMALTYRLLILPGAGWNRARLISFAIALAWAAHPLQVSTVLYVVQRMEMLWVTFTLLALIAYLKGRTNQIEGRTGWPWIVASILSGATGFLAKENAILLPAFTLALELTLLQFSATSPRTREALRWVYASSTVFAVVAFLAFVLPNYLAPEIYQFRDFSLIERLLTQLRVLPMYLGQILLPMPMSMGFYYDDLEISRTLLDPWTTLAGGLFLASAFAACLYFRTTHRMACLGFLWFLVPHILTSNVHPLEIAFEHRNYFSVLGVVLLVACGLRALPGIFHERLRSAIAVSLITFLCIMTLLRSATWGNELHLALDLVAKNPNSPRASNDLATLYIGMSDANPQSPFFDFGMTEFERGSRLPNASPLPEQGLIISAATTGMPVKDEWWERLLAKIESRPIGPQETMAVMGILTQREEGVAIDDEKLAAVYGALSQRASLFPHYHARMGNHALVYLKDEERAKHHFANSVLASKSNPAYIEQVIGVLISNGHIELATFVAEFADSQGIQLGGQ